LKWGSLNEQIAANRGISLMKNPEDEKAKADFPHMLTEAQRHGRELSVVDCEYAPSVAARKLPLRRQVKE